MTKAERDKLEKDYEETRAEVILCLQANPSGAARRSYAYAIECCEEFERIVIERHGERLKEDEERLC